MRQFFDKELIKRFIPILGTPNLTWEQCLDTRSQCQDFIRHVITTNELPKIDFKGHTTNFEAYWNSFKENPDYMKDRLIEDVSRKFYEHFVNVLANPHSARFESFTLREYCFECGEYCHFVFSRLQPEPFVANECSFKEDVVTLPISFKTDTLCVADYFRLKGDAFKIYTEGSKHFHELDINCNKGRLEMTKLYLAKNIVHISVGNSSPSVYKIDNDFYFGSIKEDSKLEQIGWVCTDLWAVTMVEKTDLEKLMDSQNFTEVEKKQAYEHSSELKVQAGDYEILVPMGKTELTHPEFDRIFFILKKK